MRPHEPSEPGVPSPTRRQLLAGAGAFAFWPVVPVARLAEAAGSAPGGQPEEEWISRARAAIPAAEGDSYFQTGGIGPAPTAVMETVKERLDFQNRSPARPAISSWMARIEPDLRGRLARVFGARTEECALTHSTSEGISIVAWGRNWERGDEVVISNTEHPANVIPWYVLRDRFGIRIREVDLSPGTDLLAEVERRLGSRTRLVSLSHVSRNNGRRLRTGESARLGARLRGAGILYHLDGAQAPGCVPTDFAALGCDAYSLCGHKWLLGPKGTGALFVRAGALEEVRLSWAGAHSHAEMDYRGHYRLLPSAARYEFGTRALAGFAGFARAVSWMEELGFDRIHRRIQDLVGYAVERVKRNGVLSLASPEGEPDRSGIFVVRLPGGCDPHDIYHVLGQEAGVLGSPVRGPQDFRLSIHFFNTRAEIAAALDALAGRCV